jgi:hypothetical protein
MRPALRHPNGPAFDTNALQVSSSAWPVGRLCQAARGAGSKGAVLGPVSGQNARPRRAHPISSDVRMSDPDRPGRSMVQGNQRHSRGSGVRIPGLWPAGQIPPRPWPPPGFCIFPGDFHRVAQHRVPYINRGSHSGNFSIHLHQMNGYSASIVAPILVSMPRLSRGRPVREHGKRFSGRATGWFTSLFSPPRRRRRGRPAPGVR